MNYATSYLGVNI